MSELELSPDAVPAPASNVVPAAKRPLFERIVRGRLDFFFRYDFFISYRWSDGRTYAVRLQDELQARGFVVFLDSSDYAKGDDWREEGRRALARSSRLLLVASPAIFQSEAVRHEVEIFARLGRRILPIDIARTLASGSRSERLLQLLPAERLRFVEPHPECLESGPTKDVVEDICRSFELIKQQARRVRILIGIIAALACLLLLAGGLGLYAEAKRRQALTEGEAKEWQRLVAEGGRAAAILDDPAEWSAGLAIAARNTFAARNAQHPVPRELHLSLLRAVWAATPYRVLAHDMNPTAQAHFASDGRVFAITDDQEIAVIDPRSGATSRLALPGLPSGARLVSISPSGTRILVVAGENHVGVWSVEGTLIRAIEVPDGFIPVAAFATDEVVFTASRSGSVRSWPLAGGGDSRLVWSVPKGIVTMAVARGGDEIAVADDGAQDPGVQVRNLVTGRTVPLVAEHSDRTRALAFSLDGKRLASADESGMVRLWDTRGGTPPLEIPVSSEAVSEVAMSKDGNRVAIACFDKAVHIWDIEHHHVQTFHGHLGPVGSVSFSPDTDQLLSASEDGTIRLWSFQGHPGVSILAGRMDSMCGQATPTRGDRIALIGQGQRVEIFDTFTGRKIRDLGEPGTGARSASFSPDGARVVTASERDGIVVWDAATGARVSERSELTKARSVAFAEAADRVLFAGTSGVAGVWNVGEGVQAIDVPNRQSVYAIARTRDGQLVTTGQGGGVQIWNTAGRSRPAQLGGNAIFGNSACFARDRNRLLTAGGDGIAYLWDLRRRVRLLTLAGHDDAVLTATFSPDEALIYTASDDDSVRIWDVATGAQVGRLVLPAAPRDAVELPANRFAVSASDETWIGSTRIDDLLAAACTVVELGGVSRVPDADIEALRQDCARRSP